MRTEVLQNRAMLFTKLAIALVCLSSFAAGEIHRTRTARPAKAYPGSVRQETGDGVGVSNSGVFDGGEQEIGKGNLDGGYEFPEELVYTRDEAWIYAVLATVLVGLTGIFPLFLPIEINPQTDDKRGAAKFNCILSFAVGGLLGDVFLHLLPEAWAHIAQDDHYGHIGIGLWILVGLMVFLSLEKIFGEGGDDDEEEKEEMKDGIVDATPKLSLHSNGITKVPNGEKAHRHSNGSASMQIVQPTEMNGHLPSTHNNGFAVSKRKPIRNGVAHRPSEWPVENGTTEAGDYPIAVNGQKRNSNETFTGHAHQAETPVQKKVKVVGYLNLLANFIDNFTHGIAVAGSFLVSRKVGLLTTAAIMLHEVPHEVGDFAILLRSGFTRGQAAKSQMSTALGGLFGAVVTLLSESAQEAGDRAAWVLPFTAGGFLYIALVTVLPDLLQETSLKESIKQMACLVAGIAVMAAVSMIVE